MRVGGNIGRGVLDLDSLNALSIYVLELSSYQLDLVKSLHCNVSVFLNISPDHLDRHGSMEGYIAAKKRIFLNQQPQDSAVIGVDSPEMQALAMELNLRDDGPTVVPVSAEFALARGVSAVGGRLFEAMGIRASRVGDLREHQALRGRHNHQNVAAAFAACRALGLEPSIILDGINSFQGLAHRLEFVGEAAGVRFINDSKATNAQAAEQALKAFRKVFWIAGGQPKSDGIDALLPLMDHVHKAYLIGDAQKRFAETLDGHVEHQSCGTLENAIRTAWADAKASGEDNPVVLLSPACASFDQFRDFEHRGDAFRDIVGSLEGAIQLERA